MTEEVTQKKKGGCLRHSAIGCGVLTALAILAAILVWLNLDAIKGSEWFQTVQQDYATMVDLRQELLADYPAGNVGVSSNSSTVNGVKTTSLVVEFSNPEFAIGEENGREVAREIAVKVASAVANPDRFDQIVVIFASRHGSGVTVSNAMEFGFPVADLLAPGGETSP